ncbi:NADP-dependent oxidoreductase [Kineococcus sp. SYSU DK001]|uniref:NADP-dependent oxidoreductase n=1 Tax=Kineococcus sp. SYSU DK001 TaxID=3383122 RepID=UPI003D7E12C3
MRIPREMTALLRDDDAPRVRPGRVPTPRPAAGEVLVEVHAAGVVDLDVHVRAGEPALAAEIEAFRSRGPVLTGVEFAGVVATDGESSRVGDRVFGYVHVFDGPRTHARYVAVPETALARLPERIGFVQGAALPAGGLTALEVVDRVAPVRAGTSVLVIGAAGSLGGYVVQLASARGAEVVAHTSSAAADAVSAWGASSTRLSDDAGPFRDGDAFDLVVDTPALWSFEQALPHLAATGTYVTSDPAADEAGFELSRDVSQHAGLLMVVDAETARLEELAGLAVDGVLVPRVDSVHPLSGADAAFDRVLARGKRGRVVLDLDATR